MLRWAAVACLLCGAAFATPVEDALATLVADLGEWLGEHAAATTTTNSKWLEEETFGDWDVRVTNLNPNTLVVDRVEMRAQGTTHLTLRGPSQAPMRIAATRGQGAQRMTVNMEIRFGANPFVVQYQPIADPGTGRPSMKIDLNGLTVEYMRLHFARGETVVDLEIHHFEGISTQYHAGYGLELDWTSMVLYKLTAPDMTREDIDALAIAIAFLPDEHHRLRVTRETIRLEGKLIGSLWTTIMFKTVDKGFSLKGVTLNRLPTGHSCSDWDSLNGMKENNVRATINAQRQGNRFEATRTWAQWAGSFVPNPPFIITRIACNSLGFMEMMWDVVGALPAEATQRNVVEPPQTVRTFAFAETSLTAVSVHDGRMEAELAFQRITCTSNAVAQPETVSAQTIAFSEVVTLRLAVADLPQEGKHSVRASLIAPNVMVVRSTRDPAGVEGRIGVQLTVRGEPLTVNYEQAPHTHMRVELPTDMLAQVVTAQGSSAMLANVRFTTGATPAFIDIIRDRNEQGADQGLENHAVLHLAGASLIHRDHGNLRFSTQPPSEWSFNPGHEVVANGQTFRDAVGATPAQLQSRRCMHVAQHAGNLVTVDGTLLAPLIEATLVGGLQFLLRWFLGGRDADLGTQENLHDIVCHMLAANIYGVV